jgi:hypothetical protein
MALVIRLPRQVIVNLRLQSWLFTDYTVCGSEVNGKSIVPVIQKDLRQTLNSSSHTLYCVGACDGNRLCRLITLRDFNMFPF